MVILSIQSHVAYGHVGNSAAVFPLQRLGFEVWPIHTVQFAAHAGYGPPQGQVFSAQSITDVVRGLETQGVLGRCAGVISGYIGTADTGAAILDAVARVKRANPDALYCCDPVIGDADGGTYVTPEVAEFFRDAAVPSADIATPNQFELEFLTGSASATRPRLLQAVGRLAQLGPGIVLATSVKTDETPERNIDTVAADAQGVRRVRTPLVNTRVHGTGDLIAALFFAHYLRSRLVSGALSRAVSSVFAVLEATAAAKGEEMALCAAQDSLVTPPQLFGAETL